MIGSGWLGACSILSSIWIAGLWQGLALALATTLLVRAVPTMAPRLRYRMWLLGYLASVLLPVAEGLGRSHSSAMATTLPVGAFAPLFVVESRWTLLFVALWLCGSLFFVVRLGTGLWSVRRLLRSAVALSAYERVIDERLLQLRSRGTVRLFVSDTIASPVATGYCRPAILLPRAILAELNDVQVEQVLRHELEHLERRDDWASLLAACLRCIFPLHPALIWFEHQLVATREMACDDAVLRSATPHAYAMNLTVIAEITALRRGLRLVPNLLGVRSQLGRRVEHILSMRNAAPAGSRGRLFAAAAVLLVVCGLLADSPALVVFQSRAETAPVARLHPPVAVIPASQSFVPHPRECALRPRTRRRSRAIASSRLLLAAARQPVGSAPAMDPLAQAQPAAVFVMWNDGTPQTFFATLILDRQPRPTAARMLGRNFFLLEI